MIRRPPRSTLSSSSAASDVYKRQGRRGALGPALPWRTSTTYRGEGRADGTIAPTSWSARNVIAVVDPLEHRPMTEVSYTPLTPLAFLQRSAEVFPYKTAIVYGDRRTSYRDFAAEATRLARALQAYGIRPGDRVAYLCPNIPETLVAHFAVPLAGAVLVAINVRLSPEEVHYILSLIHISEPTR